MTLRTLSVENVRNLEPARLQFDAGSNLIVGENGSGKTSLLESIYLVGRGHSFRTRRTEQLVRHEAQRLRVRAELIRPQAPGLTVAVDFDRASGLQARLDDQPASRTELSSRLPVQVIEPGVHRWVEEGPALRRRWLDWVVFHVEHRFLEDWQRYRRALGHRAAALQRELDPTPWERMLVDSGERLSGARERVIQALQPSWKACLTRLEAPDIELRFSRGWSAETNLGELLVAHRAADRERGRTLAGPHRFDVVLRQGTHPARETLSRGQQKLVGAAMILVVTAYLADLHGVAPLLLVDDPAAELDALHAQALLAEVQRIATQYVLTAQRLEHGEMGARQVFHVEQGRIKPL